MTQFKGELPEVVVKAWADMDKARADWAKAWADMEKARADMEKAMAAWDKAPLEHKAELERLHALECPGCPWNGKTIFGAV